MATLVALSAAYLYGRRAIDVFVCGICAAHALIMLMEVPAFGVGPGLKSLLDNLLSLGGNTYGYAAPSWKFTKLPFYTPCLLCITSFTRTGVPLASAAATGF